jgi:hypothetical protein
MSLSDYFENTPGTGVLATADAEGRVNVALYGRPHVIDEQTIALIMSDRLSHSNLQTNPHAAYLFKEEGGYQGTRLYLTKAGEEKDSPRIAEIRRKVYPEISDKHERESKFLVLFHIDRTRPLVGGHT